MKFKSPQPELIREESLRIARDPGSYGVAQIDCAIEALWPDDESAEAMRDILLPECVARDGTGGVWCVGDPYREEPGFYETACGESGVRCSVYVRWWPTCPACRLVLLECREWMPEWWAVEEMTGEEAGVVLNASLKGESCFPQNYVKMAVLRRAPGKE